MNLDFRAARWVVLGMLVGVTPAEGQLPDESQLPQPPHARNLPSEASLPSAVRPAVTTPHADRPTQVPQQTDTDRDRTLPSEATLPAAVQAQIDAPPAPPADAEQEQLLRLQQSEDQRPWLRLQTQGHLDRIRALAFSSDSQRLFVAGDDKHVLVFARTANDTFAYERTVRWQVQRGQAGRIYTLATAPGILAMGGYGAMGSLGEILLVDPRTGDLQQPLLDAQQGHRQRLTSLSLSPEEENPTLASMDQNGRLLHWQKDPNTGIWQARQLAYDEAQAVSLQLDRTLHPVLALSRQQVVAPVFAGRSGNQVQWQLNVYDAASGDARALFPPGEQHLGLVTALAAPASGQRLASADSQGQLLLWDLSRPNTRVRQTMSGIVSALSFRRDGEMLAVGTGYAGKRLVQLWDVRNPQLTVTISSQEVLHDVLACALSPDGAFLAYSQEGDVVIRNAERNAAQSMNLRANLPIPTRVAFSKQPPHRIAISTASGAERPLETVFVPHLGQLDTSPLSATDWNDASPTRQGWALKWDTESGQIWLEQNGQRRGQIPLAMPVDGVPTAVEWLEQHGTVQWVMIGTTGSNLYVFQVAPQGQCTLIRVLRGHTGTITSISRSHDQRYAASAGSDRTIRIWNLDGLADNALINRWGATSAVTDNQLVVDSIRRDGPLYFRHLRQGDRIGQLTLVDVVDGVERVTTVSQPEDALRVLRERGSASLTVFEYQRGAAPPESFQSFPAWQPLATLHVARNREWAFWTPAGFYDASFEGHRLFGWQVNRGLNALPDFFLAAQVRRFFERPQILARLLDVGNLPDAFDQAQAEVPGNWSTLLAQQQQLSPQITITRPAPDQAVAGSTVEVEARIRVPAGQTLIPPKAFANGVVGQQRRLLRTEPGSDGVVYDYQWQIPVPADAELLIQVAVATESESAAEARVKVRRADDVAVRPRRMFVVAAGVNDYQDAGVPDLRFATENARGLVEVVRTGTQRLYTCQAVTLLDNNVTRATWQITLENCAERLRKEATPDDLLVIFLSGHGVQDEPTQTYYYVTADARVRDILAGRYEDCLSFGDLGAFADVSCRKLVILDTCHSGAILPPRQHELKSALRALHDDLYLTLTASEGGQEASEASEKQFGLFTYWLLQALRGEADRVGGNQDGQVTLAELIAFVRRRVAEESARADQLQYPMAGPAELLDVVTIPLTATIAPAGPRGATLGVTVPAPN